MLGLVMAKSGPGEHWRRLFRGDADGARCMQPPYTLSGDAVTAASTMSGLVACPQASAAVHEPLVHCNLHQRSIPTDISVGTNRLHNLSNSGTGQVLCQSPSML